MLLPRAEIKSTPSAFNTADKHALPDCHCRSRLLHELTAVLSSKVRMPAASMVVECAELGRRYVYAVDDLHKQVTFIDGGLAAENDQFVSTGVVGKVVPTSTAAAAPASAAPITESEVLAAQKLWAESIALISKVYADEGDFVGTAGECAGKLTATASRTFCSSRRRPRRTRSARMPTLRCPTCRLEGDEQPEV